MAFLSVKKENVEKEGTGSFATTSGVYNINLRAVEIAPTKNGATQANYITDKFQSYGNTVIDTKGGRIFGMDILEGLAAVLGEDTLSDPEETKVEFKKEAKNLQCIPELTDVDVKCWVQFGYSIYKNEISERVSVKRFYRASDGASGSEVMALADGEDVTPGAQLEKDMAYATEVKYEDNITAEDVAAWKKAQSDAARGGNSGGAAAPKANTTAFPKRT